MFVTELTVRQLQRKFVREVIIKSAYSNSCPLSLLFKTTPFAKRINARRNMNV